MPRATEQLRNLRLQAGLSQSKLARMADLDRTTLSKAENGKDVQIQTISKIISALSDALGRKVRPQDVIAGNHRERPSLDSFGLPEFAKERIRRRMSDIAISTEELSDRAGISISTVSRVLTGRSKTRRQTLMKIAAALDFSWEALMSPPDDNAINVRGYQAYSRDGEANSKRKLAQVAESIPDQDELVRFGVSEQSRLQLIPSLQDENDYETIGALRSEMLIEKGPVNYLKERYAKNPNTPQADLFGPLTNRYDDELSKDPREINYVTLYARGARFYAARKKAAQQVESGEWPDLDAKESDAIDAICDLHGPLIMASAAGRRLISNAHEYETTPQAYREEEEILREFGEALSSEADLFEPDTIKAIEDITAPIPDDPQPARSRGTRIVFASSALSVLVGGAAWYAAGGVVATVVVPAALATAIGLSGAFVWEVTKKTERFRKTTDDLARRADAVMDKAEGQGNQQQKALLKRMSILVDRWRDIFEKVSNLRPEFGWAKKFLRKTNIEKNYKAVDLGDIVRSAASELLDKAHREGVKITESGLHGNSIVLANRSHLLNAFRNLIINAVQHIGAGKTSGKTIKIGMTSIDFAKNSTGTDYVVSIRDNGTGIHPDNLKKIFEKGYRESSPSVPGTGYGLFITRQIIEEHGGSINVRSEFGSGTEFSVSLPAHKSS